MHGAVATNGKECAEMGASILKQKGSVADAAITTLLCEGITCKITVVIKLKCIGGQLLYSFS